jgi:hypothetical protein
MGYPEWDILIDAGDPEFNNTGLKATSILKLTKISTISKDLAEGELGEICRDLKEEVNQKLRRIFEI